jgi:N-acetylglucosaminyl-diphospho-decaprenol L-rhamnosyltransferase
MISEDCPRNTSVSVVSHQHGEMISHLLLQLADCPSVQKVILTLNLPEPALKSRCIQAGWPYVLTIIENDEPKGFAYNHNQAFSCATGDYFVVLNPDVSWSLDPFPSLLAELRKQKNIGAVYPLQSDSPEHTPVDKARPTPTPFGLLRRHLFASEVGGSDAMTWVNASCLVFCRGVFEKIGGFDERYRMYCEDVDIGLRLRLAGYSLSCDHATHVIHPGNFASRKNLRHFSWHVASMLRLWWTWYRSPVR